MTDLETLAIKIGELVSMEIDDVENITYDKDNIAAFTVLMKNNKSYSLSISELKK